VEIARIRKISPCFCRFLNLLFYNASTLMSGNIRIYIYLEGGSNMKTKSLIALTGVVFLVLGMIVAMSVPAFAQSAPPTATPGNGQPQVQQQTQPEAEQAGVEAEKPEGKEAESPSDKDQGGSQVQSPAYTGSIAVDQKATEGMSEADEAAALQSKAAISAKDAEAAALAANPGTTAVKIELDNENGALVYSVELSNGKDVKVDAGNGNILHVEQADQQEGQQEQGGEH
jgi:uncharacterized membrane protein YkoI